MQSVVMEVDYISELPSVTRAEGRTLEAEYARADLQVTLRESTITGDPNYCWKEGELHGLMTDLGDRSTATAGSWYLHGVVVPCCDPNAFTQYFCEGYDGAIWLPVGQRGGIREHFILYSNMLEGPEHRLELGLHESGHVFNLHHCEYQGQDDLDRTKRFGAASLGHLSEPERRHVGPGPEGDGWCSMTSFHKDMHGRCETDPCKRSSPEATLKRVALTLSPEKKTYYPGEPITVNVTLSLDRDPPQRIGYLGERSLSPPLGYLRFWISDAPQGTFDPIPPPSFADASLPRATLGPGERASATGLRLWEGGSGSRLERTFWLKATYAGFDGAGIVASDPVEVRIVDTATEPGLGLFHRNAFDGFTGDEARTFLSLLGGDHLSAGRARLEAIALNFPETVYAPYANLALGVSLAEPFHFVRNGAVQVRPAEFDKARSFLEEATRRRQILPDSYRMVLHEALGRVYARLALAASDPNEQADLYGKACAEYLDMKPLTALSTALSPDEASLSLKQREALARAGERIAEIQGLTHTRCEVLAGR